MTAISSHDHLDSDGPSDGPQPGPRPAWTLPAWITALARKSVPYVMSAMIGVVGATWRLRGAYDERDALQKVRDEQVDSRFRMHDEQITTIRQEIRDGFDRIQMDVREIREKRP